MPRNGSGVYAAPANTLATTLTTIKSPEYNAFVNDLVSDANAARPIVAGGTGATSVAGSQTSLSVDNKVVYSTKAAGYTALATDNNAFLRFSAAATLSLTAAATLGANWHIKVVADGGDVIIDPNASELIDGATTITVKNGYAADIVCTGTAFYSDKMQATVTTAITALSGSADATISGTATDITGIPAGVNRVVIALEVALSGTASIATLQLGTAGGMVLTGYSGAASGIGPSSVLSIPATGAAILNASNATPYLRPVLHLIRQQGTRWYISGSGPLDNAGATVITNSMVTLGATLDRVRISSGGSTLTGTATVRWSTF